MNRYYLRPQGRKQIRRASRQAIEDHFTRLPESERCEKWLRQSNQYRIDCVGRYKRDLDAGTVNDLKLIEYIAASGPAHVIDGWSFVGRSVESLLRMDMYSAVHFAYYAELRGAMGLLACEGIGILHNKHAIVLDTNKTERLHKCRTRNEHGRMEQKWAQTHTVIVPCLEYWSGLPKAANLLDTIIQPGNINLSSWLTESGGHARTAALAKSWLNSWGLDLRNIDTDHDARNLVSYRPSEFRPPNTLDTLELATFLQELWSLFEPSSSLSFDTLQTHLLRLALIKLDLSIPDRASLEALGVEGGEADSWIAALNSSHTPKPLVEAANKSHIESDHCAMQVISRAILLLFIATRASGEHLRNTGYTREELKFWWERYGASRGFWDNHTKPDDPRDTWADISESLEDIESTITSGRTHSLKEWKHEMGTSINQLGAWDLVALWGLVP